MNKRKIVFYPLTLCGAIVTILSLSLNSSIKDVKAASEGITYVNEGGKTTTTNDYTVFDSSMTTLNGGTYYINQDFGVLPEIEINGNVKIILGKDANVTFKAGVDGDKPGIKVQESNSLEIYSVDGKSGYIKGEGDSSAAGIGSERNKDCGAITINGGNVSGYGGSFEAMEFGGGAGIGSGSKGTCSGLVINNGIVEAKGGHSSAGIGSGDNGSCSNIVINNGKINAYGGSSGAAIGSGECGKCSNIVINNGEINAYSGSDAAAIGGGGNGELENLSIYGGTIKAIGNYGSGIGGKNADCSKIYIYHVSYLNAYSTWNYSPCIGTNTLVSDIYIANDLDIRFASEGEMSSVEHSIDIDLASELYSHNYIEIFSQGYTVNYDLNGGTGTNPGTDTKYKENAEVLLANPSDIQKTGYTFEGWIDADGNEYEPGETFNMPDDPVTMYANWKPTNYSISYNLNGGTNSENNPSSYTIESENIVFEDTTKEGFTFEGWYSDSAFVNKVDTINKGSTGDVTLFAKFVANEKPAVDVDFDGGVGNANRGLGVGGIIGIIIAVLILIYLAGFFCYKYKVAKFFTKPLFVVLYDWFDKCVYQNITRIFKKKNKE